MQSLVRMVAERRHCRPMRGIVCETQPNMAFGVVVLFRHLFVLRLYRRGLPREVSLSRMPGRSRVDGGANRLPLRGFLHSPPIDDHRFSLWR